MILLLILPGVGRGQFTWTNSNGAITITGYTGPGGAITIPATINGLPVINLGNPKGFYPVPQPVNFSGQSLVQPTLANNSTITGVTIANGIRNIGIACLEGCANLGYVSIPASVTNIGPVAFGSCPSLTNLTVAPGNHFYSSRGGVLFNAAQTTLLQYPAGLKGSYSIPATVRVLGIPAFNYCTNLTSVTIPAGVTNISEGSFAGCAQLTAFTVAANNLNYRSVNGALYNWSQTKLLQCPGAWVGNFTVPQSVNIIDEGAFLNCPGLTGVLLPNKLASLGDDAFANCTGLTNVVVPHGVSSIGIGAFSGCQGLASVTLGQNVTNIGADAFSGCSQLAAINLPDSLTSIGLAAFQLCRGLSGITVPNGVVSLGASAFSDTGLTNAIVGSGVTVLADEVFANDSSLTNVTLTGRVTSMGQGVFEECSALTTFTIPDSVTNIGSSAFAGTSLTSITIPTNVISIGISPFGSPYYGAGLYGGVFYSPIGSTPSLQAINVAPGNPAYASVNGVLFTHDLTTLIEYPYGLSGSYTIPAGVTTIETNAFADAAQLTGITIPSGVTGIGDNAFEQCYALGGVSLPDSVTNLGNNVFAQCAALTNAVIGQGVTSIGRSAFNGCQNLGGLTLPDGLLSLGEEAFSGAGLTMVVIPATVTNIGSQAFESCLKLAAINVAPGNRNYSSVDGVLFNANQTILLQCPGAFAGIYEVPNTVTSIGSTAFANCLTLTGVKVPASVTNLADGVFLADSSLTNVFFAGNAPATVGQEFYGSVTVTFTPGASGWTNWFAGVPAAALGSPTGALQVTILPADQAVQWEANWQVAGGLAQAGDETIKGLTPGTYTVTFNTVAGWTNPASQTVLVTANATNRVTGIYAGINQIPPPAQFLYTTNNGGITITSYLGSDEFVAIPDTINGLLVTAIGGSAFQNNFNLSEVTIPPSVTSIGNQAFQSCYNLTSVAIPAGVTSLGDYAFAYCNNLAGITLPEGVASIGEFAFTDSGLTNVTIPNSVTNLGDYAFAQCRELASVTLPDGLTSLGNAEFQFCASLTSVTIPSAITNIGDYAFFDCTNLVGLYFLGNAPEFGFGVFWDDSTAVYYLPGTTGWLGYIDGVLPTPWHPPTGALQVTINPAAAADGAQWQLDGGPWQNSGATVSNLLTGSHAVSFNAISGWTSPAGITVQVTSNVTTTASGTYLQVPGAVQVIINPTAAASAGAEWRVNGGAWQTNGATVGLTLATTQATVSFNMIHGWSSPASQTLAVTAGQTNELSANYQYDLRPTISINNLANGQTVSNTIYTVTGTASDPTGVAGVWYQINGGGWLNASGTTNWSATVTLTAGLDIFQAYAVDTTSNESATDGIAFRGIPSATLPVQIVGQGTISPDYSNAVLAVGGHYHMTATAKPGSGFAFTNWTGFNTYTLTSLIINNLGPITETNVNVSTDIVSEGVLTNGPTLAFTMAGPQNIYTTSGTNADGSVITSTILTLIQGYQANFVDVTKPVLHITNPTAGAFVTNYNFLVQGTAVDNAGVSNVWYQFNGGGWQNPNSLNQWSVPVTLNPGTNTIQAYAVDTSGNVSATNTVNFVYVFKVPFFLTINGQGTVTPNYRGQQLQVGENYAMTAIPAKGFAFTNWHAVSLIQPLQEGNTNTVTPQFTGIIPSDPPFYLTNSPTLKFTMGGFLAYIANFMDIAPPSVTIQSPFPNAFVNNYHFLVQGTASDNAAVANVWYQFNGGGWLHPTGTNQWSVPVYLNPGTNTFQVYAVDTSGNVSKTNTVNFVYVLKASLKVTVWGPGTISPNYNGQQLQLGQTYAMTARPANGFGFVNWASWQDGTSPPPMLPESRSRQTTIIGGGGGSTLVTLTNQPTLFFTMSPGMSLVASFADIAPPVFSVTAPRPNQLVSNTVFTVTGTARDNVGVAGVYYQLNGTGWQSVSTGNGYANWYTPALPLRAEGTNILQVYAVDFAGNTSPTSTIDFKNLQRDPAPVALANTLANGRSFAGTGFTFDFGTNTFSLAPYVTGQTPSVGQYSYEKLSPTNGELSFASTAPPSAAGGLVTLDLKFTARDYGTYSNEISGDTGTITFGPTYPLIPGTLAGKTMQLFSSNGVAATLNFAGATVSFTNTGGDGGEAHYAFQPASQISGLLAWGDAEQGTNYLVLINDYTNVGAYYASAYDAAGKATGSDSGIYALPASAPSAPASLNGTEAQIHGSDGSQSVIAFGAGTYSVFSYDSPPTAGAGTYGYAQNHTRSARLSLAATWPPGTTNSGQSFALNFVTPRCAWYTNPAAATSNIECLVLFPAITEAPASVTGLTLHATNYTERFINNQFVPTVEAIELQARGFFTQVETAGSQQTTNAGTWKYQVYSPVVAVFQLNYRGSGSLAGATNYLQATFYQAGSGLLNETFFDHAGDPAVTSLAGFSIY